MVLFHCWDLFCNGKCLQFRDDGKFSKEQVSTEHFGLDTVLGLDHINGGMMPPHGGPTHLEIASCEKLCPSCWMETILLWLERLGKKIFGPP